MISEAESLVHLVYVERAVFCANNNTGRITAFSIQAIDKKDKNGTPRGLRGTPTQRVAAETVLNIFKQKSFRTP